MPHRLTALLCLLPSLALAQDGVSRSAPPSGPQLDAVPWWLWVGMFIPPLFLVVAGYIATRRFDQQRGGGPTGGPTVGPIDGPAPPPAA